MTLLKAGPGIVVMLAIAGCRQDMHNQPSFRPLRSTTFFADGRSARSQPAGTVARSQTDPGSYFNSGLNNGGEGESLPMPVSMELLLRGQERFNIYCAPCHSRVGNGKGMIVERGYYPAANLHSERLRSAYAGHYIQVIKNGYGAMPSYATELSAGDRWAVVAYIRALQLSQHAAEADRPAGTPIRSTGEIAKAEGLPDGFLNPWLTPGTAKLVPSIPVNVLADEPTTAPRVVGHASQIAQTVRSAESEPVAPKAADTGGDAAAGKLVYAKSCAGCHQASLAGIAPMIPSLIDIVPRVGTNRIDTVVHNGLPDGKPPMPSFAGLPDKDYQDLLAYLRKPL